MCGLSGYSGIKDFDTRLLLVIGFGKGIESRGNSAAGFVSSLESGEILFNRKSDNWTTATMDFLKEAASGDACLMHARASGYSTAANAHPFPIVRDGKIVLWGAHNGSLHDAWGSAKNNNRAFSVDSAELFELLADREFDALKKMHGYGVVEYIDAEFPRIIKLSRLTKNSDLVVVELEGGGVAYASTAHILRSALSFAGLSVKREMDVSEVGMVYHITNGQIYYSNDTKVELARYSDNYHHSV